VIWSALGRAIYWTLGAAQAVVEIVGAGKRLVRQVRNGTVPSVDETDPMPISHRSVEQIQGQIRSATGKPRAPYDA
jgi:hypothetical protein